MYNIVVGKKTYKLGLLEENMIDNRKLKVYLDTSVISYLQQEDAPEKTRITLELWERFKSNIFDVCLSDLTLLEVGNCEEPKVSFMRNKRALSMIKGYKNINILNPMTLLEMEV